MRFWSVYYGYHACRVVRAFGWRWYDEVSPRRRPLDEIIADAKVAYRNRRFTAWLELEQKLD